MMTDKTLKIREKKLNRSVYGNVLMSIFIISLGIYSILPIILSLNQSLKPLNELFLYPPRFFVRNPTFKNFEQLLVLMNTTWVPFSRYIFNSLFITILGTFGHIILCSMAAYPLAKHKMPGGKFMFGLIVMALMFNPMVGDIVNYMTMSILNWTDTYFSMIVPAFASAIGLFIMRQFMLQIPDSLIEAARIDGASEYRTFWQIIMPNVKPAWLTVGIFAFITLWNQPNTTYVYREELKTLPYALNQIVTGGIMRAGAGAAVAVAMMIVPIAFFIMSQNRIIETMSTSGMKE